MVKSVCPLLTIKPLLTFANFAHVVNAVCHPSVYSAVRLTGAVTGNAHSVAFAVSLVGTGHICFLFNRTECRWRFHGLDTSSTFDDNVLCIILGIIGNEDNDNDDDDDDEERDANAERAADSTSAETSFGSPYTFIGIPAALLPTLLFILIFVFGLDNFANLVLLFLVLFLLFIRITTVLSLFFMLLLPVSTGDSKV